MDLSLLRKIGLTDGEIKIYSALIELGQSPIFKIMKKSGVSSSKVYLILDRLIQKGLISFIKEDNTKLYQVTNPKSVLDTVQKKKDALDDFQHEYEKLIPEINMKLSSYEEESAQVYKGIKGMKSAYYNLLGELEQGDEYYFFGVSEDELSREDTLLFFKSFHAKRIAKKVKVKAIADTALEKMYKEHDLPGKLSKVRFHKLTMPLGVVVGKNRVIIVMFGEMNLAYELVSKRLADKYRDHFKKVWATIKNPKAR